MVKNEILVNKIEKLIVDGQKEVLTRLDNFENGQKNLENGQKRLGQKMDSIHSSLKNEIKVTALAVKEDLKEEIKEVKDKLDQHIKQPAHA